MSVDGFVSTAWGPAAWLMIHLITLSYPISPTEEDKAHYSMWFEQFEHVLPCAVCRVNFKKALFELSYTREMVFASRDSFARFGHRLHEHVSSTLNKCRTIRYDDMVEFYEKLRATNCSTSNDGCTRRAPAVCSIQVNRSGVGGISIN
jgi:hypothetical protein